MLWKRRSNGPPPSNVPLTERHFRKLTDDESLERYQVYVVRLVNTAKGLCQHYKEDSKDSNGHDLHPCQTCIRIVRHVLELWAEFFKTEAVEAAEKMHNQQVLQAVQLHHAYELGMAVLWPEAGKAIDGWGPL